MKIMEIIKNNLTTDRYRNKCNFLSKTLLKSNTQNDPKFRISQVSSNDYRNFGLGWGYRLGGGSLSSLGSNLGGRFGSRFLSWFRSCFGD
jgi:hypothetical protein